MNKLRKCKGKCNIYENGKWHSMEFELGYFHEWGVNYKEFCDSGPEIIPLRLLNCLTEELLCLWQMILFSWI